MLCKNCEYCEYISRSNASRYQCFCEHPDSEYIREYYRIHKISKYPGFLGYTKKWSRECPIKTAPAWCPLKAAESEDM